MIRGSLAIATIFAAQATTVEFSSFIRQKLSNQISASLEDSLVTDGAFIISNAIDSTLITELSQGLSECSTEHDVSVPDLFSSMMVDGTLRTTFASRSNDPFFDCIPLTRELATLYKERTQKIGIAVAGFLDGLLAGRGYAEQLSKFVQDPSSDSLDHFHVYTPSSTMSDKSSELSVSVPFHVDMGLFLLLTPAIWTDQGSGHSLDSDLIIKRKDGTTFQIHHQDSSSNIVLLGSGINNWLYPGSSIRAAVHAVIPISSKNGEQRVVLGRMFLLPMNHISGNGITFEEFFKSPLRDQSSSDTTWRRLSEAQCEAGAKYCWMSCMPDLDCGGPESVCKDVTTGIICPDNACDENCKLVCPVIPTTLTPSPLNIGTSLSSSDSSATASSVVVGTKSASTPKSTETLFCRGATSMVMTGFESVGSTNAHCIILFFRPWLLDTAWKFAIGCVGIFALGMFVEAAILMRRKVTKSKRYRNKNVKEAIVIALFAINVTLGYLCMLAAMTFNVEIFFSAVMGLALGHLVFANSKEAVRETADPCCVTTEGNSQVSTGLRNSTGACCCEPAS